MKFLLLSSLLWALNGPPGIITWKEGRLLEWGDFKAEPPEYNSIQAKSYAGLSYKVLEMTDSGATVRVEAVFDPEQSWVRPEDKIPSTLAHEQIHFDITEVCARACRKLIAYEEFNAENFRERLAEIMQNEFDQSNRYQEQFDYDTSLPRNLDQEKEWGIRVNEKLRELEAYRSTVVNVKF